MFCTEKKNTVKAKHQLSELTVQSLSYSEIKEDHMYAIFSLQ